MSNLAPSLRLQRAIIRAVSFLELSQDEDGHWRDYQLAPGRSEAWTTACAGCALLASGHSQANRSVLERAATALLRTRRPAGWGYNRTTSCDADSTSWVIRFLAELGVLDGISAVSLLGSYVTTTGHVRTFGSLERFGTWAMEHDEVAPLAGLALSAAGDCGHVSRIREAIIETWTRHGWQPFWWQTRAYVCAQSLEFLTASGGIPEIVRRGERQNFIKEATSATAFEVAQWVAAATYLGEPHEVRRWGERLLGLQATNGSWPSSAVLLVPSQKEQSETLVYSDDRRILTTAVSLIALSRWIHFNEGVIRK